MNLVQLLSEELERSSLRDLEAKTGISHTALLRIVRGQLKSLPEIETLDKIAKAFSLPLWRILEMAGADLGLDHSLDNYTRRLGSLASKQEDYQRLLGYLIDADPVDIRAILNYFAVSRRGELQNARVSLFDRRALETRQALLALAPTLTPDLPAKQNVYEGKRVPVPGSSQPEPQVTVNGRDLKEQLGRQQVQYEWGFSGAGPGRLAEAMLAYEFGPDIAERYRVAFATDIVSALPRSRGDTDWALESQEILIWMLLRRLLERSSE
jgi:transcriptional regulator with XRE-family HTH domain